MPEAQRKQPVTAFDDAPESGVRARLPAPAEKHVRPPLWLSCAALLFTVSITVGLLSLACGLFDVAAFCAPIAAISGLALAVADAHGAA